MEVKKYFCPDCGVIIPHMTTWLIVGDDQKSLDKLTDKNFINEHGWTRNCSTCKREVCQTFHQGHRGKCSTCFKKPMSDRMKKWLERKKA